MVFAAVITVSLFNGLNTNVWTGWVFFAVFLGIVLLLGYTVMLLLYSLHSNTHYRLAARLQCYQSRLDCDRRLRQQPIPVWICLLLAVSATLRRDCAPSEVSLPRMGNWLCSWRLGAPSLHSKNAIGSRHGHRPAP